MNKEMLTFSFFPTISLFGEGKWLLAVNSFEATISVSNITIENNTFSITTPGYWFSRGAPETIHNLQKFLEFRSQNDIELNVEEVRKRRNQIKIGETEFEVSEVDYRKNEIIEGLGNINYNDLEDMVYRLELTYTEIEYLFDSNYIDASFRR